MPEPFWPWCPTPGASRATELRVDEVAFGDGYKHRAVRGLNPARPAWTLSFPFTSQAELQAYDDFLTANATAGFYMRPPDSAADVFVTVDAWSSTIADRNVANGIVGTLQATFTRSFNPQPS